MHRYYILCGRRENQVCLLIDGMNDSASIWTCLRLAIDFIISPWLTKHPHGGQCSKQTACTQFPWSFLIVHDVVQVYFQQWSRQQYSLLTRGLDVITNVDRGGKFIGGPVHKSILVIFIRLPPFDNFPHTLYDIHFIRFYLSNNNFPWIFYLDNQS